MFFLGTLRLDTEYLQLTKDPSTTYRELFGRVAAVLIVFWLYNLDPACLYFLGYL